IPTAFREPPATHAGCDANFDRIALPCRRCTVAACAERAWPSSAAKRTNHREARRLASSSTYQEDRAMLRRPAKTHHTHHAALAALPQQGQAPPSCPALAGGARWLRRPLPISCWPCPSIVEFEDSQSIEDRRSTVRLC